MRIIRNIEYKVKSEKIINTDYIIVTAFFFAGLLYGSITINKLNKLNFVYINSIDFSDNLFVLLMTILIIITIFCGYSCFSEFIICCISLIIGILTSIEMFTLISNQKLLYLKILYFLDLSIIITSLIILCYYSLLLTANMRNIIFSKNPVRTEYSVKIKSYLIVIIINFVLLFSYFILKRAG